MPVANIRLLYLLCALALVGSTACEKDAPEGCLEQLPTARFSVNGLDFDALELITWSHTASSDALLFMQERPNGEQHVVNIIFIGDTAGTYPLLGINAANRASYFAPGLNGTTFPDTVIPGALVITHFDVDPLCLSGHYSFTADTLLVSGEFECLRPN